jgi:hypothetical protein
MTLKKKITGIALAFLLIAISVLAFVLSHDFPCTPAPALAS